MQYFRQAIVWSFVLFAVLMGPIVVAQAVEASGTPMPKDTTAEWGNSFLWAIASSWLMRWWREHPKVAGFTEATALKVQRLIAAAVAFFNGLGITIVFDPDAGTLVVSGLFLTAVLHAVRQFLFQELVYQAALKRPAPTS